MTVKDKLVEGYNMLYIKHIIMRVTDLRDFNIAKLYMIKEFTANRVRNIRKAI